ncbi:hypothetical protein [Streptomyces sp. WAC07061]|uniref:hypothetical protein n=1 Tax=Streptomyces sp. WAC07061 TaxID=2487410 RepID=UPI00163CC112|nr:hypothetical protein [Streptomyces sp. WAC07061]
MPALSRALRGAVREPVAVAAFCVVTVHCVGLTGAVQSWADGRAPGLLPFLALDRRTGWVALRAGALWTVSFLCLSSGLVVLLLGKTLTDASAGAKATGRRRRGLAPALLIVYPLLALPANLAATAITRSSGLTSDPPQRGNQAEWLFREAYTWDDHALFLGLVGGIAAALAAALQTPGSRPTTATRPDDWKARVLTLLEVLPRWLGGSLPMTVVAVALVQLLTSDLPNQLLTPLATFWCGTGKDVPATCVPNLSGIVTSTLPIPVVRQNSLLLMQMISAYAVQTFGVSFFVVHVLVRRLLAGMPPVIRSALCAAAAYTAASNVYYAVSATFFHVGDGAKFTSRPQYAYEQLITLTGLPHALYGAPLAAVLAATAAALHERLGRRAASSPRTRRASPASGGNPGRP